MRRALGFICYCVIMLPAGIASGIIYALLLVVDPPAAHALVDRIVMLNQHLSESFMASQRSNRS
jgi:hypothetical protein